MRTLLLLLLVGTAALHSCSLPVAQGRNGETFTTALEYNNYIIERQNGVIYHIIDFSKMAEVDLEVTEMLLNRGVKLTDSVLTDVKNLSAYKGDSSLRNAAVSMFTFYHKVFDEDYREMLTIRKKGTSASDDDYLRLQQIQQRLEQEEGEKDKYFHNAQQDFAEKNGMRLRENDLQQRIDEAG